MEGGNTIFAPKPMHDRAYVKNEIRLVHPVGRWHCTFVDFVPPRVSP